MKKKIIIIASVLAVFFLFLIIRKCLSNRKETPLIPKVEILKIEKKPFKKHILLSAKILPKKTQIIKSKIPGRIEAIAEDISEGSFIEKGEIVANLENSDYRLKKDITNAAFEMAISSKEMATICLKDKELNQKRMQNLFDKKAISKKQLEISELEYKQALVNLNLSNAKLKQAKAQKEEANILYLESFIKSPISGVISQKYIEEGDNISPASPMLEVVDITIFKIIAEVPERFISKIKKNQRCKIVVDAYPNKSFFSKVKKIYPTISKITKMATVELELEYNKNILPGMFSSIEFTIEKKEGVIQVPKSSLVNKEYIYLIEDNKAHLKKVSIGLKNSSFAEIKNGINIEDEIVILGLEKLQDGCEVEKVEK